MKWSPLARSLAEILRLSSGETVELEVAGNKLANLPELGSLTNLVKLAAFGNVLAALPDSIGDLPSLRELWLQGNRLSTLPPSVCRLEVR